MLVFFVFFLNVNLWPGFTALVPAFLFVFAVLKIKEQMVGVNREDQPIVRRMGNRMERFLLQRSADYLETTFEPELFFQ